MAAIAAGADCPGPERRNVRLNQAWAIFSHGRAESRGALYRGLTSGIIPPIPLRDMPRTEPDGVAVRGSTYRRERSILIAVLGVVALWTLGVDWALCPTAGLFGIPCPSCGLTRATLLLLIGDWRGAMQQHPLVVPVLGSLAIAGVGWRKWHRSPRLAKGVAWLSLLLIAAMTLLWLARFRGFWGGPVAVRSWRF